MLTVKYAASSLLRTSKSLVAKPLLMRGQALRPMTILSKESAEEYKKKVCVRTVPCRTR